MAARSYEVGGADSPEMALEAVPLPLWKEVGTPLQWLRLRASWLYTGRGIPGGDGEPVMLVPGFLCSDFYLRELHRWLRRIGYRTYASKIRINAGCVDRIGTALAERADDISQRTGRRVHIVGHSLGGLLGRSVALLRPDVVASVVALGSPLQALRSHRFIVRAANAVSAFEQALPGGHDRCMTSRCSCAVVCAYTRRLHPTVPMTAVYTRNDGVVDWESCTAGSDGLDVEVGGTHMGLIYNPDVYRAVADHLARAAAARAKAEAA